MQTILVPTDFSQNAYNAAHYAMALAEDIKATKIILYNAYEPYVAEDPELGLPLQLDIDEFKKISVNGLMKIQNELQSSLPSSTELIYESDYNSVALGVGEACKKYDVDIIIMGISSTDSKLEEAIIGSTSIDVAKESEVPVIIVPSNAQYSKLKKILLALDFKKVSTTTPVQSIKKLLNDTNAQLDILHVDINNEHSSITTNEQKIFDDLFNTYHSQFHFVKGETFTDAINQFATENNSDLIIVIPKKHGLFEGIFKKSHTKALAFHSHIPIMTIHE